DGNYESHLPLRISGSYEPSSESMSIDEDHNIYIADRIGFYGKILKYDFDDKLFVEAIVENEGEDEGEVGEKIPAILVADDRLYVADQDYLKIKIFDMDGTQKDEWALDEVPEG